MTDTGLLSFIDPSDPRWVAFINEHPDSSIFHHPGWIELVAKSYGYTPHIAVLLGQDSQIKVGLPLIEIQGLFKKRKWVSLPFTDHCSPLYQDPAESSQFLDALQHEALNRNIADIQIRWNAQSSGFQPEAEFYFTSLALDPDPAVVTRRIKGNDLRKLRAAERHNITVDRGTSTQFMDAFYSLHLDTRHRKGLPIQPRKFFENMQHDLLEKGLGFVMLAKQSDEPVAGVIYLNWKDKLVYKFAASNQKGRQTYASDPVVWEAIRWGCENGYSSLDWGRTDLDDEGLLRFKMRWGSQEDRLIYVSNQPPTSGSVKEKMAPILQKIISKSPKFVSRLTGEILYKYFG